MSDKKKIDAFIKEEILDDYRPIFKKFQKFVKKEFPELSEEMRGGTEKYYGIPVYRKKNIVLSVSPTKKGITFAFTNGKSFSDKYKLLEGTGKKSLNLRISSIADYDEQVMKYYMKQAIDLDK